MFPQVPGVFARRVRARRNCNVAVIGRHNIRLMERRGSPVLSFSRQPLKRTQRRMRERTETVIAAYRPKPGKHSQLRKLIDQHRRALDAAHLITRQPTLLLRARSDGTVLEIFEWISAKAADEAHQNPTIRAIWNKFTKIADFVPLSAIQEAGKVFSHFEALTHAPVKVRSLASKRPATKRPRR
jgi:hypothetical protein